MIKLLRGWFVFIVPVLVVLGFATSSLSCVGSTGVNIFPVTRDVELGKHIDAEIRKNPQEYPILQGHPEIQAFVEEVGKRILASPLIERKNIFACQFEVIHDDSTVNAFCTPGGYIDVYPGAIRYFFEKVSRGGKGSAFERLLSTQPLPQDRIENVNKLLTEHAVAEPTEATLFTARYQELKKKLPPSK